MIVYYLDASAWLKRYFAEPGASWVRHLFSTGSPVASSPLGYIEVAAALARQSDSRPTLPATQTELLSVFESHWRELLKVEIDESVFRHARALAWDRRLRGADAIHLAAADFLRTQLSNRSAAFSFVTSDAELVAAARSLGMETLNPIDQHEQDRNPN